MLKRLKSTLDQPRIWVIFRWILENAFGLYSRREKLLIKWGVQNGTVLDVACGTGQFHGITKKGYLGVDLNGEFIERARVRHASTNVEFRQCDVKDLQDEGVTYDTVLLVGILHHLDDETVKGLLATINRVAAKQVVMMEVIQEQSNPIGRLIKNNDRGEYVRHWEPLSEMIANCGFELQEWQVLHLGPIQTVASRWYIK